MIDKPDVKTVALARKMSLTKWNRVKAFSRDLFNEIEKSCGFCELGRSLTGPNEYLKCKKCVVSERCKTILKTASNLEEEMEELINETIRFLENMDVTEK